MYRLYCEDLWGALNDFPASPLRLGLWGSRTIVGPAGSRLFRSIQVLQLLLKRRLVGHHGELLSVMHNFLAIHELQDGAVAAGILDCEVQGPFPATGLGRDNLDLLPLLQRFNNRSGVVQHVLRPKYIGQSGSLVSGLWYAHLLQVSSCWSPPPPIHSMDDSTELESNHPGKYQTRRNHT
jgi:hypothetical protein